MLISLHKQATTTPKIRAAIQASDEPAWKVAETVRLIVAALHSRKGDAALQPLDLRLGLALCCRR